MTRQGDDDEYEYEEEPLAPLPPSQPRRAMPRAAAYPVAPTVQPARRPTTLRAPAPARSTVASMVLGFMGAVVVGLLVLIVVVLLQRPNAAPAAAGGALPAASGGNPPPAGAPAAGGAPRIVLAEFKTLYDDPAKRPVIVDVRAADAYAQGHIAGAISIPEAELATKLAELPKNRLIVAYCQ